MASLNEITTAYSCLDCAVRLESIEDVRTHLETNDHRVVHTIMRPA